MIINDEEVLEQLQLRKAKLTIEISRVNVAIKAFEGVNDLASDDILAIMKTSAMHPTEELVEDEIAIATLIYNPHMNYYEKVLFVLGKIHEGTAKQIADYILTIDKSLKVSNIEGLYNRITYVTSRMYRIGKIDAVQVGKKNLYKLKS